MLSISIVFFFWVRIETNVKVGREDVTYGLIGFKVMSMEPTEGMQCSHAPKPDQMGEKVAGTVEM